MSDQVFYIFSAVLLGLVIGALIMYFATGSNKDSEQTIAKLKKELENYQQDVAEHFEETADLVDGMTQSYKKVFDHLGKSARKLMTKEQIQQQLEFRKGNKVTLEYLTEETDKPENLQTDHETVEELAAESIEEVVDITSEDLNTYESNDEGLLVINDAVEIETDIVVDEEGQINDDLHIVENSSPNESDDEVDLEKEVEMREKNIYS